jgi:hypothetical protein
MREHLRSPLQCSTQSCIENFAKLFFVIIMRACPTAKRIRRGLSGERPRLHSGSDSGAGDGVGQSGCVSSQQDLYRSEPAD